MDEHFLKVAKEKLEINSIPNEKGCILWQGSKTPQGYGFFCYKKKKYFVHRVSWMVHYGPIRDNLNICHKCDVPLCINPLHLWMGTNVQNIKDMWKKGRNKDIRGEKNHLAKLTTEQVIKIKHMLRAQYTQIYIARRFGVCRTAIAAINRGYNWGHVKI